MPGYIVFDPYTQCTQGVGVTPEAAMADAKITMALDGVQILDSLEQADDLAGDTWVLASDYRVVPASDALYDAGLWDHWQEVDGVACTPAEAAAASMPHMQTPPSKGVDGSSLDPSEHESDGHRETAQPVEELSEIEKFFLAERSGPSSPEENKQLENSWVQYHGRDHDKLNRMRPFQKTKRRFTNVDPVDVLRAALTQARSPTEWARTQGLSPSYVRQVLRRERGAGPKLLDALKIVRFVAFKMSTSDAKSAGTCKRPEIAGYAVKSNEIIVWVGVREVDVWNDILSWDDVPKEIRSLSGELTCRPCSQGLFDKVQAEGLTRQYTEVDGVLCLEDEASVS